ncbi:MAG: 1-acyl-sn-glycerol-3-phosphate acyltransferase [Alphaproteobacteria bacterium]|nr:1-acyl-sn-glycerol-3-phosphate acyltransferase [Alphaproteobacteria bacterium]
MARLSPHLLRQLFYALLVRPVLMVLLGLNVRNLARLRAGDGAHIIAANHNSHLDALVLMSLIKLRDMKRVKLVAARDYFCRTPFLTWFSLNIIGVIPIDRQGGTDNPLAPVIQALDEGYTIVIFPEGSRGEPEKRQPLKYGVAKLLETHPHIEVTPVFMYGLGKALPRGEGLLVPFMCDINIGERMEWPGDKARFIESLEQSFTALAQEIAPKPWH